MIGVIMRFGTELIEIRVVGNEMLFRTTSFGGQWTDIKGLKLSKSGVIKEFPELKDDPEWREKTWTRFKDKIKKMKTEKERIKYAMEDLIKYGYKPEYIQKAGFRPKRL